MITVSRRRASSTTLWNTSQVSRFNSWSIAVVTGASSQIGVFLLPLLAGAGYNVVAVSRSAPSDEANTGGGVLSVIIAAQGFMRSMNSTGTW